MVNIHFRQTEEDWTQIALMIPGVTPESCKFKWLSLRKVTLINFHWQLEESLLLGTLIKDYSKRKRIETADFKGKDWKEISQELYKKCTHQNKVYRSAKLCK